MYTLIVRAGFDAAHFIPGHSGKCAGLHGHGYRLDAEFSGTELNELGMLCDFADLKSVLNEFLPDHVCLNDVMTEPPTAENVCAWIFRRLAERGLPVTACTLWETERYACRYSADARG